jgi:hypothetical protein
MATVKLYLYQADSTNNADYSKAQKGEGLTYNTASTYQSKTEEKIIETNTSKDADGNTTVTTISSQTYYSFSLTLSKLSYTKKVYDHGEILAEVQVGKIQKCSAKVTKTVETDKDGKELSNEEKRVDADPVDTNLSGDSIHKYFKGAWAFLEIGGNNVAENYKVFKILTRYKTVSNGTSHFLELTINSADMLMDLDKYSRAYTARKLYTDILKEESGKFFLQKMNLDALSEYYTEYQTYLEDSKKTTGSSVEKPKWDSPLYIDGTAMSSLIADNLQLLKYTRKEVPDELRIPYLVQYDETFYQFLKRVANRFGEFLYFENGKLNLGVNLSDGHYYEKDANGNLVKKDGANVIIDWAAGENGVQSRYYENGFYEGINVEDRAYNYINHTKNDDSSQLYAASSGSRYNPDPVAVDEWARQELEAGKYLEYGEVLGEEMKGFVVEVIFKALEASTLSECAVNVVKGFVMKCIEVGQSTNDLDRVMDKAHYKDKNDNYIIDKDQRDDEAKAFTQFVTYGQITEIQNLLKDLLGKDCEVGNLCDLFYSLIRKKEKEITEQAVWLDFGNNYKPIKLGDKLRVDGKDYVAISVEGSYDIVEKVNSEGKTTKEPQEHLLVSAIPLLNLSSVSVLPPTIPDAIIREAEPQVAFVTDTLDPENLGRIRVRYPWQDSDSDASPWIRVTLPLATKGGAVNFTPCKGDEVMVGYVHGNIDHPYAMGYLASKFVNKKWSNAMPLDQYGGVHGIKTKTGHHLTFSDGFALVPMMMGTLGCLSVFKSLWPTGQFGPWPLGWEQTADFGGGFELSDRYGFYKIKGSTDERSVTIESPVGTVEVNAFQGITISAPNGDVNIKGKNVKISASNRLSLSSGENIKDVLEYKKKWSDSKASGFLQWGITDLKGGLEPLKETATNIADISFIRCVVELLLRPVNGSLQIKSYSFVTIEAGDGKVEVHEDSLRTPNGSPVYFIAKTAELIKLNVVALIDNIKVKYGNLYTATQEFNNISRNNEGLINKNESAITFNDIKKATSELTENSTEFKWENAGLKDDEVPEKPEIKTLEDFQNIAEDYNKWKGVYDTQVDQRNQVIDGNSGKKDNRDKIIGVSNKLRTAVMDLSDAVKKWTDMTDNDFNLNNLPKKCINVSAAVKIIKAQKLSGNFPLSLEKMKTGEYDNGIGEIKDDLWDPQKQPIYRYCIYKYLKEEKGITIGGHQPITTGNTLNEWGNFVNAISDNPVKAPSIVGKAFEKVKDWANEELNPRTGWVDDHKQWAYGFKGKILMSDKSAKTAYFDELLNLTYADNRPEADKDAVVVLKNSIRSI